MNKKIALALAAIMLVTTAYFAGAQLDFGKVRADVVNNTQANHNVVVQGEGAVLVKPDIAYINLGLQTKNKDSKVAQETNKKTMLAIYSALEKAGVKAEDIATTNFSIYQVYVDSVPYESSNRTMLFQVSNNIKITTTDLERVGALLDIAVAAGANQVNGIDFSVKDNSKYYDQALKLAMASAKSKAGTIMSTFGKKASIPVKVTELSSNASPIRDEVYKMSADVGSTPVQAGDLTVTAKVQVEYGY